MINNYFKTYDYKKKVDNMLYKFRQRIDTKK